MNDDLVSNKEIEKRIKELAEENLSLRNKLEFQDLFSEYSNSWMTFRDRDGNLMYVSPSFEQITGYSKEDYLIGKFKLGDIIYQEDKESERIQFQNFIKKLEPANFIIRIHDKENKLKYLAINSKPVFNLKKECIGYVSNFSDVTSFKIVEEELKQSEEIFKTLSNVTTEMLELKNLENIYEYITHTLHQRYPSSIVLYISVDEKKNEMCLENISGLEEKILSDILEIIGYSPIGKKFSLHPIQREYFRSGKIVEFKRGLSEIPSSEMHNLTLKALDKLLGLHQIYTIGINKDQSIIAALHIFLFNNQTINDPKFIEAFVQQAGIIIQKKTVELTLKSSEERFIHLLKSTYDTLVLLDPNGIQTFVSKSVTRVTGYNPEELINIPVIEQLIHPDDQKIVLDAFQNIILNGSGSAQYRHKHKNGGWVFLEAVGSNQLNNPFINAIVANVRDISERKKTEQALIESQMMFKSIIDNLTDIYYRADAEGKIVMVSPSCLEIFGYSSIDEVLGGQLETLFIKANERKEFIAQLKESGKVKNYRTNLLRKDGSKVYIETTARIILDNNGNYSGVEGIVRDLTERKRSDEALKQSEERYRNLVEQSPYGIAIYQDGVIVYINPTGVKMMGAKQPNELLGKSVLSMVHPDSREVVINRMKLVTSGINVPSMEEKFVRLDGTSFDVEVTALTTTFNEQAAGQVIVKDITEHKKYDENLLRLNQELKELNATKDKLFSIIAHDLKTPFNSIIGFSQLLLDSSISSEGITTDTYPELINSSAKNAVNLLDNLLIWAKTQTGQIDHIPKNIKLQEVFDSIIDSLHSTAKIKNISLTAFQSNEIIIYADPNMVQVILRNLIANAIKFTNSGGRVHVFAIQEADHVVITVSDNGVGIDEDKCMKLFTKEIIHSTMGTANEMGSGLGLALCKDFVAINGGQIWATSIVGKGSDFKFTLPLGRFA